MGGLFTDKVKILLNRLHELRNKIFIAPIIRVKENANRRNSMLNVFVWMNT